MNLSEPIYAALIGAAATVITALVQLRISWRKELKERERGQPITKKTRRGPVLAVMALMIAAAVGGFSLSQYLMSLRYGDQDALRTEMHTQLAEIKDIKARLERDRSTDHDQIELSVRRELALHEGEQGTVASVSVGPCASDSKQTCAEQSALRVAVCARVPASATVKEVLLYTRPEDSQQAWSESLVQPGQDAGQARFLDKFYERPDAEAKQVCQRFATWNSEKARLARIVVKYSL
jgi:hypothetical protein